LLDGFNAMQLKKPMAQELHEKLAVTPALVAWARERAGYTVADAEKYFKHIETWESGENKPTYPQIEAMAEKFKCPVALFFFPHPPEIKNPTQSFRTLSNQDLLAIPRPVKGLLRKGQAMQLNVAELNDQKNPATTLITRDLSFRIDVPLQEMADQVRQSLAISIDEQLSWTSTEDALERWRGALSNVGIYAFKDAFHVDGYFGFCLYDDEFPIIYVNNSAAKTRQIFTLFHELAHLLFHTSGIDVSDDSYIDRLTGDGQAIELICNRFASIFLVPNAEFDRRLVNRAADRTTAELLADAFKVSREVVYRKMLDRGLISSAEYREAAAFWRAEMKRSGSGGNYYFTQFSYLGTRYIDLAFHRYHQRRFDETQLAQYLNIKPRNLAAFEQLYERP
jgi:Zn-dependent peptidase ImmA (M78 family)/transcriptional regulator with XRE-family HTH domain